MKMIHIKIIALICCLCLFSSCYDETDKTEAFEPFTKFTFTPADGNFEGATVINVDILAPGLESATVNAIGGEEAVNLGTLNFANGAATLTVNVADLKGANRLDFTATHTDGRPFTTRYNITY